MSENISSFPDHCLRCGYEYNRSFLLPAHAFGVEFPEPTNSSNRYKFTGKERDAESGLDYFGARYYGSSMGRWMSADPLQISQQRILDPQQWNMYSYVRNSPLSAVDPDGRELHIIVVNHANVSQGQVEQVGTGIASNYTNAGVQNVSVGYASSVPFLAVHDIGVDTHTVYVELQANHNGQADMAAGVDGQNNAGLRGDITGHGSSTGPGGSVGAVETTSPGTVPSGASDAQAVAGMTAVGTHESAQVPTWSG